MYVSFICGDRKLNAAPYNFTCQKSTYIHVHRYTYIYISFTCMRQEARCCTAHPTVPTVYKCVHIDVDIDVYFLYMCAARMQAPCCTIQHHIPIIHDYTHTYYTYRYKYLIIHIEINIYVYVLHMRAEGMR